MRVVMLNVAVAYADNVLPVAPVGWHVVSDFVADGDEVNGDIRISGIKTAWDKASDRSAATRTATLKAWAAAAWSGSSKQQHIVSRGICGSISTTIRMISNRRHSLKHHCKCMLTRTHVSYCYLQGVVPRLCVLFSPTPVFCAVLQHVRHETMLGVGPGKRQGVCAWLWYGCPGFFSLILTSVLAPILLCK